ncbi:MAG: 4-hydroxythreonine-4-phosphate dehydrogenase PdxA [Candidatus Omnitrophica bacterium]|nr:4-hydroxythreonine-4-phosphate dehydrogenase PdxA [Candidatus Omnitrophota bacterium]MBI3010034.1 4-hydroxythreonine-4-phosphate dehydrogenase PdxA [Candidatus Omnitrophota bacterium]
MVPTIAITAGDPCGIGPEVILKTLDRIRLRGFRLILIGHQAVFRQTARRLHQRLPDWKYIQAKRFRKPDQELLVFLDCPGAVHEKLGRPGAGAGRASLEYLNQAVELWRLGLIQGIVTAPVTKWAIAKVDPAFIGHTEYFSGKMGVSPVVMMFASSKLRMVVLTRHIPLSSVSRQLTPSLFRNAVLLTHHALQDLFRILHPRIAVLGINPHAGEQALCGMDERRVMIPLISLLRRQGIICEGPFAADGFFAAHPHYDAVLCAYHDQGLIPFKMLARDTGCQITLGLPIVRTSPDHGSALDIAGKNQALPGSMIYALRLAIDLAGARANRRRS